MKKYLLSFVIYVCCLNVCSIDVYAQETYTLERCISIGLERNYSIRIVHNEEQITANNATAGNAGYLPVIDLSGGYSGTQYDYNYDYKDGSSAKENGINTATANAGLNLNWTIFDGFTIQANYAQLKELQEMGRLNTRMAIENLVTDIASEYYNFIRQGIRLKNLRSAVRLSRERLRIVEERYIIGSMSRLDLQQAKVDFNADSSQLLNQYEAVNTSQIRLNELMGLDSLNAAINITDSIALQETLFEKNDIWQKTLTNNTLMLTSQKNRTLSELDYKKLLGRNYPYLRFNAGYGLQTNRYNNGSVDLQKRLGANYGLTVGFTVFDGFNRRREQRNARLQIQNTELRIQEMELALNADLSNIWMAYRNNLEIWSLEKENLATARENYDIAIERYKLGDLAGIELREAQNNLLNAEERRSISEYNTKLCEISLLQLSGQIMQLSNPSH